MPKPSALKSASLKSKLAEKSPKSIEPENIAESEKENAAVSTANFSPEPAEEKKEIKTRGLDFIINASLFLIFFLCPIFFTGLTVQGMGFDKLMLFYFLVLSGAVAWIGKGVILGGLSFKKTPLDIPIIVLFLLLIVSTVFSINSLDSLLGTYGNGGRGLLSFIVFAVFYFLLVNNINASKLKLFFWAFLISGLLTLVCTILHFFGIFIFPLSFTHSRIFNPVGSISDLSVFLAAILPMFVIIESQAREIHKNANNIIIFSIRFLFGVVILTCLAVLAILNNFIFWPIAVAGIFILLLFFLSKSINISHKNLIVPVSVFFILVIFWVSGRFNFVKDFDFPSEANLPKSVAFQIAKSGLLSGQYFGSGPSNYYWSFSKFKPVSYNNTPLWNTRFDGAPGIFFESASIGPAAVLTVLAILLIVLISAFRSVIKENNSGIKSIVLGLATGSSLIAAFGLFFYFGNGLILISVLMLSLTAAASIVLRDDKVRQVNLSIQTPGKSSMLLSLLFLCVSATVIVLFTLGGKLFLADVYAKKSLTVETAGQKIDKLNKAISLVSYRDIYFIGLANNYIALAKESASSGKDAKTIADSINKAISFAKKGVEINPAKASNSEALALIYENAASFTGSATEWAKNLEETYNKIAELDPNSPTPYLRLAMLNIALSSSEQDQDKKIQFFSEAIKQYDLAISKKGNLSEAYYGKGIAYEKLHNVNEAIEQVKNAVYSSGQNVDYFFELGRLYYNRGILNASKSISRSNEDENNESAPELSDIKERNADIDTAEGIFLEILKAVNTHANAQYSLAVIYKTVGERDKAQVVIGRLLEILQSEQEKEFVKKQFPGLY